MALVAVNLGPATRGSKPFVEEYAKANPKCKLQHLVVKIFLPKSGKGAIIETDAFNVFVWKGSPSYKFFMEAVKEGLEAPGFPLVFQISSKDPCYTVAYDDSRTAFFIPSREGAWELIVEPPA